MLWVLVLPVCRSILNRNSHFERIELGYYININMKHGNSNISPSKRAKQASRDTFLFIHVDISDN